MNKDDLYNELIIRKLILYYIDIVNIYLPYPIVKALENKLVTGNIKLNGTICYYNKSLSSTLDYTFVD